MHGPATPRLGPRLRLRHHLLPHPLAAHCSPFWQPLTGLAAAPTSVSVRSSQPPSSTGSVPTVTTLPHFTQVPPTDPPAAKPSATHRGKGVRQHLRLPVFQLSSINCDITVLFSISIPMLPALGNAMTRKLLSESEKSHSHSPTSHVSRANSLSAAAATEYLLAAAGQIGACIRTGPNQHFPLIGWPSRGKNLFCVCTGTQPEFASGSCARSWEAAKQLAATLRASSAPSSSPFMIRRILSTMKRADCV